jgi:hypothetical protein
LPDYAGAISLGTDPELNALKDAGKRMSDALNAQLVFNGLSGTFRWMAFKLDDGSSDGAVYDTRADAIKHQKFETQCWYEQILPSGAGYSPDVCAMTIQYARVAYDAGFRPSIDAPTPIQPVRREHARLQSAIRRSNRKVR